MNAPPEAKRASASPEDDMSALQAHMMLLDAAASIISEDARSAQSNRSNRGDAKPDQSLSLADLEACRREQRWLSVKVDSLERKLEVQQRVRDAAGLVDRIGHTGAGRRDSREDQNERQNARLEAERQFQEISRELSEAKMKLLQVQNKVFRGVISAAVGFGGPLASASAHGPGNNISERFLQKRQRVLIPDKWDPQSAFCSPEQLEMIFTPGLVSPNIGNGSGPSATSAQMSELDGHVTSLKRTINRAVNGTNSARTESSDGESDRGYQLIEVEDVIKSLTDLEGQVSKLVNAYDSSRQELSRSQDTINTVIGLWDFTRTTELHLSEKSDEKTPFHTEIERSEFTPSAFSALIQHVVSSRARGEDANRDLRANIAAYKTDLEICKSDLTSRTQVLEQTKFELESVKESIPALEAARSKAETELSRLRNNDIPKLEDDLVRIQTALTVCRAELDRGDGPRAERVALDVQIDDLASRNSQLSDRLSEEREFRELENERLKRELASLLTEFEELTKANLCAEKERTKLESQLERTSEKLRDVEGHLADERMKQLGRRRGTSTSTAVPLTSTDLVLASRQTALVPVEQGRKSPSIGSHGKQLTPYQNGRNMQVVAASNADENIPTQVLRDEFKKMMRDIRSEGLQALKAEQIERKKLEAELRALRRERIDAAQSSAAAASKMATSPRIAPNVVPPELKVSLESL